MFLAFITVFLIETTLICIGNAFTIFVFWNQRQTLKRACYLLINLAVADLLVGASEMLAIATERIPERKLFYPAGSIASAISGLFSVASVLFLALISLERAYAVLWPFRHRTAGNRMYIISIIVVWIAGLGIAMVNLLTVHNLFSHLGAFLVATSTMFISLCTVLAAYMKIRAKLRSSVPVCTVQETQNRKLIEQNKKLSNTLFIVIRLSFMFWMPAVTMYSILPILPTECIPQTVLVMSIITILHMANSLVNPIVYSYRMPMFKAAMRKLLKKKQSSLEILLN